MHNCCSTGCAPLETIYDDYWLMNNENGIRLRKIQDHLTGSGRGYILFGLWSVLKSFMLMTMDREMAQQMIEYSNTENISEGFMMVSMVISFLLLSIVVMSVHFGIGLGAVRYSKGKRKKTSYLFFAVVALIINVMFLVLYFILPAKLNAPLSDTSIASFLMDLTVSFILFDIICSTVRIKRLRKE